MTHDAHRWMLQLRLPNWYVAKLRELHVGEQLWVGLFGGPGLVGKPDGECQAYFERERGCYTWHAVWTICFGTNRRRAHILTFGKFRLCTGNKIEFISSQDKVAERTFRVVCRYCNFFLRHRNKYGLPTAWRGMMVDADGYIKNVRQFVIHFLNQPTNQPEEQNDGTIES